MFSTLIVNFVFFVAKLFSSRHKDTKTLRTNSKKNLSCLCALVANIFWFSDKSGFLLSYNRLVRVRIFNPTNPVNPVKKI